MDKIQQILTELEREIIRTFRSGMHRDRETAITNAAEQIRQQERERVKELINSMRPIIAEVKTNPEVWSFFDPILLKRYEAALKELEEQWVKKP